jgi:S-adenosylmethionine:diacylglycerol 3-amino-3-carboxypropyl transferase
LPIQSDMLYYSHINEDSRIERSLLDSFNCSSIVAVGGSGERVLALMDSDNCKSLKVIDVNQEALYLLQLKLAALSQLNVERYLKFIGHNTAERAFRLQCLNDIKSVLSPAARMYWEERTDIVSRGVLDSGHFEKFLTKVRPIINLILGKEFKKIFSVNFTAKAFLKYRWKLIAWIFSQIWIYKLWGNKDIAFIGSGSSNEQIPSAIENIIYSGKARSSFIVHLIFKGHLQEMAEKDLPLSLQKERLRRIQERILNGEIEIEYYAVDLLQFARQHSFSEPVFYSISDILSFENQDYLNQLLSQLSGTDVLLACRSFLRNRLSPGKLAELAARFGRVEIYDHQDATGMYQVFSVRNSIVKRINKDENGFALSSL